MAEGQDNPQGPFFYQEGAKHKLPSIGDDTRHTEEPAFRENAKGLHSRRHQTPKKHYGKGPENSCVNATGIFMKCGSQDNASDAQSQCAEGNGQKATANDQTKFLMMEFWDFKCPSPSKTPGPQKRK